jgi:hypothetical protein
MQAMQENGTHREHPKLKELVVEASLALARLDAGRLEELALSCQALNRDLPVAGSEDRARLARQAQDAASEMAVFARVLEVTRSNLSVMNRLRELRAGRLEYSEAQARGWARGEDNHGDN